MNDMELLILAASAIGLDILEIQDDIPIYRNLYGKYLQFCPLQDKGQCLEMEIDLKLKVEWLEFGYWCVTRWLSKETRIQVFDKDRQRASTMAAAEIGKRMLSVSAG